jgi:AraC-like DNA-binding protein
MCTRLHNRFDAGDGGADPSADAGAMVGSGEFDTDRVAQLRGWLDRHVADATLTSAARALARSRRSLQRDLHLAGSSFRTELLDARVRRAKTLLLHTAASLTEIAHDVGCASLQHFSLMFRLHSGETPSQWREQQRNLPRRPLPRRSSS